MKYRKRIYYTEADKALMWDRCSSSLRRSDRAGDLHRPPVEVCF